MQIDGYILTGDEELFLRESSNPQEALLYLYFALAFNTLAHRWITDNLEAGVRYDSQSVLQTLNGRQDVARHIAGKIEALKKSGEGNLARVELGYSPDNGLPCAIGYQRENRKTRDASHIYIPQSSRLSWKIGKPGTLPIFISLNLPAYHKPYGQYIPFSCPSRPRLSCYYLPSENSFSLCPLPPPVKNCWNVIVFFRMIFIYRNSILFFISSADKISAERATPLTHSQILSLFIST